MYRPVELVRLAGRVRRAREMVSDVGVGLVEIGVEDCLFELANIECELEQIHFELLQPARQRPPRLRAPECPQDLEDLPF
jgi:hypothetical protein